MTALAILLADGNGRGGGDLKSERGIIGSWVGDRIVIAGDYADPGKFMEGVTPEQLTEAALQHFAEGYQDAERVNLYAFVRQHWTNISKTVIEAMADDTHLRSALYLRGALEKFDDEQRAA